MTIKEFQDKAHEFSFYEKPAIVEQHGSVTHKTNCDWIYPALGLAEESGEVAGKFAKIIRDKKGVISFDDEIAIVKELGDVAWMLAECCTVLGVHLEDVLINNIQKLTDRRNRNTLSGSGDDR